MFLHFQIYSEQDGFIYMVTAVGGKVLMLLNAKPSVVEKGIHVLQENLAKKYVGKQVTMRLQLSQGKMLLMAAREKIEEVDDEKMLIECMEVFEEAELKKSQVKNVGQGEKSQVENVVQAEKSPPDNVVPAKKGSFENGVQAEKSPPENVMQDEKNLKQ